MNKFIILSVLSLVAALQATELGLEGLKPSELKEVEREIAAGNVPPNYTAEKPKRGVATLTNTDNPNFNHISSGAKPVFKAQAYNTAPQTYAQYTPIQAQGYATPQAYSTPSQAQQAYTTPYRLQYYPANQYLSYLQNPQIAAQLGQYTLQPSAVPHYLQTPTQIQYVSPPNYQHVPSAQFKALTSKAPVATTSSAQAQSSTPLQTSSVQAPVQYQQPQQYVMYLVSPQQQQALLAQQQALLYPGHQMLLVGAQNPLLSLYGGQHRFGLPLQSAYTSPATTQLQYLSALSQQQQQQQQQQYQTQQYQASPVQQYQTSSVQQVSTEAQKQPINVQESAPSNQYGLRTKA